MADKSKLTRRIRRLMALGTQNSNDHEAARAVALAQRLMRRHGLTDDQITLSEIGESVCEQLTSNAEKVPAWMHSLATVVCMATGCRCWFGWYGYVSTGGLRLVRRSLHFYGFGERPELALYIYTVLQRKVRAATDAHMSTYRRQRIKKSTLRGRADQFREGWVSGVWQVLQSFSTPDGENQVLQRWLAQRHSGQTLSDVVTRQAKSCRGDLLARNAGWFAGRQAELSHGLAGAQANKQLTAGDTRND
ncbi:DUF2786 domain-containing protein [Pantoea ananatis]|jgi:hypothetical protein|uniref:DUF2786 domain-containing protein n=1 Tax=Pantoea ananas TaxID=553 RepID=UPI0003B220F0|nr:DUF2786 domain-containing protein [Pantoea ananatis]AMB77060.1 hypothetical protein AW734_00335 [Pantoea ananatis]ASN13928.1 DUF2786 domain-containing protein [Pantoea ananatis]ERM15697.1 hypothetical protein L585_02410 [Pantoea ananatis BRT175]MCW0313960.1 hypothetical protein [Pantoea ananatis]MDH0053851.1 DUF2786 domain-containing protein [Pantoea ananatis]